MTGVGTCHSRGNRFFQELQKKESKAKQRPALKKKGQEKKVGSLVPLVLQKGFLIARAIR